MGKGKKERKKEKKKSKKEGRWQTSEACQDSEFWVRTNHFFDQVAMNLSCLNWAKPRYKMVSSMVSSSIPDSTQ